MNKNGYYTIELRQFGEVVKRFSCKSLEEAKKIYRRYTNCPFCSTELYIDGERIKYGKAWDMMSCGFQYLDFSKKESLLY